MSLFRISFGSLWFDSLSVDECAIDRIKVYNVNSGLIQADFCMEPGDSLILSTIGIEIHIWHDRLTAGRATQRVIFPSHQ